MKQINREELRLLAFLRDIVRGFGERYSLPAEEVIEKLESTRADFEKDASYLEGFALIGTNQEGASLADEDHIMEIWLTTYGESYLRALDTALATPLETHRLKRLTAAGVVLIFKAEIAAIVKASNDFVMAHHPHF